MIQMVYLSAGAIMGASARYFLGSWINERFASTFPYATLLINVLGSFVLGYFLTLSSRGIASSTEMRLLIAVGFCGSFTTLSTLSYETFSLIQSGALLAGLLNAIGSIILGVLAVFGGVWLARLFPA